MMRSLSRQWATLLQGQMVRNASWLFVGQGLGVVLQALNFIVLARLLGSYEYGIFVGAFAFTSLVAQYSALGMGAVFLRYVSGARHVFSIYWGNILLATTTFGTLLAITLYMLAPRLLNPQSAALVVLLGFANCLFAQLTLEIGRVFQAFEKMPATAILNLLTNLMRALASIGLLVTIHHASAWNWAVATTIVSSISSLLAISAVTYYFGRPKFDFLLFSRRSLEGAGFAFASSTTSAYNDLDKTMLSHYGMNQQNGIYSIAYRVVDMATIPIFSIRDAALPRLFQRGREGGIKATSELGQRLLKRSLPISLVLAIGMFLLAPLVPLLAGKAFNESAVALRWLCWIPVFRSIHQMTGCALTGAGYQNQRTMAQLAATALNFGLNFWLIPIHGWHGAAWASLVTDGALGMMNYGLLKYLVATKNTNHVFLASEGKIEEEAKRKT